MDIPARSPAWRVALRPAPPLALDNRQHRNAPHPPPFEPRALLPVAGSAARPSRTGGSRPHHDQDKPELRKTRPLGRSIATVGVAEGSGRFGGPEPTILSVTYNFKTTRYKICATDKPNKNTNSLSFSRWEDPPSQELSSSTASP